MRNCLMSLFLLLFAVSANSQDKQKPKIREIEYEKLGIGVSLSALANLYPGGQVSLDTRINKDLNFSIEGAYIFAGANSTESTSGFRIKPGIQKIMYRFGENAFTAGFFIDYRYCDDNNSVTLDHWNENYRETVKFSTFSNVIGGLINVSSMIKLGDRFVFEFGGGGGFGYIFRHSSYRNVNIFPFFETNEGRYLYPLICFNINFRYVFIK